MRLQLLDVAETSLFNLPARVKQYDAVAGSLLFQPLPAVEQWLSNGCGEGDTAVLAKWPAFMYHVMRLFRNCERQTDILFKVLFVSRNPYEPCEPSTTWCDSPQPFKNPMRCSGPLDTSPTDGTIPNPPQPSTTLHTPPRVHGCGAMWRGVMMWRGVEGCGGLQKVVVERCGALHAPQNPSELSYTTNPSTKTSSLFSPLKGGAPCAV